MELKDTIKMMQSDDYKERFVAEYQQTKIRYEKLKAFNTKIEASHRTGGNYEPHYRLNPCGSVNDHKIVEMPKHDCPDDVLREQQNVMEQYLHILEVRAEIEGIVL